MNPDDLTAARRGRTPPNHAEMEYQYWRLRDLLGERDHALDVAEERAEKAERERDELQTLVNEPPGDRLIAALIIDLGLDATSETVEEAIHVLRTGFATEKARASAARAEGFREGLEAAAKVADKCASERYHNVDACRTATGAIEVLIGKATEAERIAAAIRALAPKETP